MRVSTPDLYSPPRPDQSRLTKAQLIKVFCFFFSKKKGLSFSAARGLRS